MDAGNVITRVKYRNILTTWGCIPLSKWLIAPVVKMEIMEYHQIYIYMYIYMGMNQNPGILYSEPENG